MPFSSRDSGADWLLTQLPLSTSHLPIARCVYYFILELPICFLAFIFAKGPPIGAWWCWWLFILRGLNRVGFAYLAGRENGWSTTVHYVEFYMMALEVLILLLLEIYCRWYPAAYRRMNRTVRHKLAKCRTWLHHKVEDNGVDLRLAASYFIILGFMSQVPYFLGLGCIICGRMKHAGVAEAVAHVCMWWLNEIIYGQEVFSPEMRTKMRPLELQTED